MTEENPRLGIVISGSLDKGVDVRRGESELLVYYPQANIGYHAEEAPLFPLNGDKPPHRHILYRG